MFFQHKIKIKQGLANFSSLEMYLKKKKTKNQQSTWNLPSTKPTTTQLSSGCQMLGLFPWSLTTGFSEETTQDSGSTAM